MNDDKLQAGIFCAVGALFALIYAVAMTVSESFSNTEIKVLFWVIFTLLTVGAVHFIKSAIKSK